MRKDLRTGLVAVLLMTVVFGGAYPLLMTAIAQPLFGDKADGDTRLLGVARKGDQFFQPRPSATGYSTTATYFSNLPPNSQDTVDSIRANATAYAEREDVPLSQVPHEQTQTSASGIDPDITPDDARIQARRVARVNGLPLDRVLALVKHEQHGRVLGLIGEPTVNVNDLNTGLESLTR